ncbi:FERM and PDZ domain-containing protein 4 isoform X1 [Drosophila pseudoobscura]|uniref:FERM and PDZ domain-containing protein 4 isoform X1 n=1 Tax=Drosophila pseudoobscura pseudoobscura TaxID=46245 RepID=A0A6I8UQI0_DROPS|nr:FERM and PDZ domain-containing protein 4 isoform X1 [Drosophila pseudoobscura]
MMLLPSGRSNSDVYPLQSANNSSTTASASAPAGAKPLLLTRTSSPQLTTLPTTNGTNAPHTTPNRPLNGVGGAAAAGAAAGCPSQSQSQSQSQTGIQPITAGGAVATGGATTAGATEATTTEPVSSGIGVGVGPATAAGTGIYGPLLGQSHGHGSNAAGVAGNWSEIDGHLETIQEKLKPGWTVHSGKEGRLYYCNHLAQTSGWLPACEDWSKHEELSYGWERAIDSKGRSYYINHLNKTTTYEAPECIRWDEHPPEPRLVHLQRNASLGFGFVAGSERPVIVRFVTEGGPSIGKLQPGDQILAVNGEDVKDAPRDHVIQLVRACESQVSLLVCQPMAHCILPGRKSTLLSAGKRAKLRSRPSRVRFAESVCVNGAPLFPPSAFSLGDICVPPMANVLKVFLENGQTKSFKYDATTTVHDVVSSLLDKLCLCCGELFSLVLEHVKSLKRNKLTLLDPQESLARIAARPGAHKLRCLFRITFVPISAAELAQRDLHALDYLYMQCCNDVNQERFAPELQPELALRLAALHMHQHALANNFSPAKLTVKLVEREFGLERFVPVSLFEGMKRKELRRLISHFLKLNAEMTGSSSKVLTQLQAKLHYLDIIASLPSYGAKCFSTNQREGVERVLLVSPRFGLSQISSARNSVPQPISAIEDFTHVVVNREDDVTCSVSIFMLGDRAVKFIMEDRDACEFSLVLGGYYRLLTGNMLNLLRERDPSDEDNAPGFLSQHTVLPAGWSYLLPYHTRAHSVNFLMTPPYHPVTQLPPQLGAPLQAQSLPYVMDLDLHSVMATELLEEAAKDSGLSDSSGSNYCEGRIQSSHQMASVEAKNEQVLRRVQELQHLVQTSEQYLSEQEQGLSGGGQTMAVLEFDSDCDSLNSSKVSSTEETSNVLSLGVSLPPSNPLKHSDSLTLLAETISHDLSGITQGLNAIPETVAPVSSSAPATPATPKRKPSLCSTSSPRPQRKMNGFSQLLSDLQALGTDFSQSESDSESVASPAQSPTARRPQIMVLQAAGGSIPGSGGLGAAKQPLSQRSSFGLHSPDGSHFGAETKDYNLREYLQQLKEISNASSADTDVAARQLSEIYGFEVREDTFIETDPDLIDLRAIPPPQTPDELDSLSLMNAAPPKGFEGRAEELDSFLQQIMVAPPTQKATPAKELTPEEIMSFIIPPPPNLEQQQQVPQQQGPPMETESLYSNSVQAKREFFQSVANGSHNNNTSSSNTGKEQSPHVIEYATVERKSKFSCCPTTKKEESSPAPAAAAAAAAPPEVQPPPRTPTAEQMSPPPARPPKSAELLQRYSPKKQVRIMATHQQQQQRDSSRGPPQLPPRGSPTFDAQQASPHPPAAATAATAAMMMSVSGPKKPPLPPIASRPRPTNGMSPAQPTPAPPPAHYSPPIPATTRLPNAHSNGHQQQLQQQQQQQVPLVPKKPQQLHGEKLFLKNGHLIDGEALLGKTDVAMAGLLIRLDQVAAQCSAAQSAGGGTSIDEEKFQRARNELTEQTLALVTASKFLVASMSDMTLITLPEHLTSCLTAIRRITELAQDMTRHTSAPLQTRNIVLKVHDVASSFRELVGVQIGPIGAGQLALQAECLANVLATLLRSLRVFSP